MGRPKGSRNRKKDDVTSKPAQVEAQENAQEGADAGVSGDTPDAGGGSDAGSPALDEHKAEKEPAPTVSEIPEMTATLCNLIRNREDRRAEAREAARAAADEIKALDSQISHLAERIETADLEEIINHDAGIVAYKSRTTGKIVRTRPIVMSDAQQKLPFDGAPAGWPKSPSFWALAVGMILEHEGTGYCKVLELRPESAVILTDDWVSSEDDRKTSIATWTREDWDNWECWPMPVPSPQVGETWEWADGREGEILAVDGDWYRVRISTPEPNEMYVPLPSFVLTTRRQQAEAAE